LGKSSSELKEQLREQAAKFCENITSFESQKTHFELKLSTFQSLIDELEAGAKLDELFEEVSAIFHCEC
jgi:hypothetical protein